MYVTSEEFTELVGVANYGASCGDRVDFYVLTNGDETHGYSIGVRFGEDGHMYLSPLCRNSTKAKALVEKYTKQESAK